MGAAFWYETGLGLSYHTSPAFTIFYKKEAQKVISTFWASPNYRFNANANLQQIYCFSSLRLTDIQIPAPATIMSIR